MKGTKRILTIALAICLVLAVLPGFAAADETEAVGEAVPMLISAEFVTRAEAVAELYALDGEPAFMNANVFTDVPDDSGAEKAIVWASGKGIVNGYGDGVFGPDDSLTREQLVTILWRYARYKELDVSVGESTNILSYDDAFDVSAYAVAPFQWACGEGITTGSEGCLRPFGGLTGDEFAAILDRFAYIYGLSAAETVSAMAGGWALDSGCGDVAMPDAAREAFDLAADSILGASCTALAYLGSQVAAGTNYAYLCRVAAVTPEATDRLAVVIVYRDLSGNAEIAEVRDVYIGEYNTGDVAVSFPEDGLAGGWTIWNESNGLLPKRANEAFDEAVTAVTDVAYAPAALLGTQIVAGTNYAFLCTAVPVDEEAASAALAVVIVYSPLEGEAAVTSAANFSIR